MSAEPFWRRRQAAYQSDNCRTSHAVQHSGSTTPLCIQVVVISMTDDRFQNSLNELLKAGIKNVRRHVPQHPDSAIVRSLWTEIYPSHKPTAHYLRLLSLALATKDILHQAAGEYAASNSSQWWLVLEDDIKLNTGAVNLSAAMLYVFGLAKSDGVAKLGMCTPESCTDLQTKRGIGYGKCSSHCTHAVAYSSQKARFWQGIYGNPEPGQGANSLYSDLALLVAGKRAGGFWSAGLNFLSATNPAHSGLFLQDDKKFKSLLT